VFLERLRVREKERGDSHEREMEEEEVVNTLMEGRGKYPNP